MDIARDSPSNTYIRTACVAATNGSCLEKLSARYFRQSDLVVGVVQVVVKHMLSGEQLIAAIFKLITRVFKTVSIVTTGINIVLAEVIAGAHLVGHGELLTLLV